jgi:predicted enzyme related to lactoylglutathione lyase
VPAARKFYSGLFGWTFREIGNYTIAENDERPLGGLFQRPRPDNRPEAHPRWFGYLSVKNLKKTERKVTEAGGRVLAAPQKLPNRGEQAIFVDPEGAVFGAMTSASGDPQDFLPEPGDWIWIQLLSRDGKKAADFYRAVGGYEVVENTTTNRMTDYILTSGGYARATVRTIAGSNNKVQPDWLVFVRVQDVTASIAKAKELGGKVLLSPRPEVLKGKVAIIADPTGAAIGILEWDKAGKGGE